MSLFESLVQGFIDNPIGFDLNKKFLTNEAIVSIIAAAQAQGATL